VYDLTERKANALLMDEKSSEARAFNTFAWRSHVGLLFLKFPVPYFASESRLGASRHARSKMFATGQSWKRLHVLKLSILRSEKEDLRASDETSRLTPAG
jgi:hypothetical protein